jgi:hypothetical protein
VLTEKVVDSMVFIQAESNQLRKIKFMQCIYKIQFQS